MNRKPPYVLSLWLIVCSGLLGQSASADLRLNLSQAEENGLNLADMEFSLNEAIQINLKLDSDNKEPFSRPFDLVSLNSAQANEACDNQQLLDLTSEMESFKTLSRKKNFLYKNRNDCTLSYASYSMVIAYPLINMVTTRPQSPADFFDIERFPGKRALPDSPIGTLEWALLAYGIPINEVYQLLSTKRGLKLAFAKLESIKRHILWWRDVDELKKMILDNQVTLASGPHTVFYDLQLTHPMEILWNSQLLIEMKMGINAASENVEEAKLLLSKVMTESVQFKLAYEYAIGPTNKKTLKTLALLPQAGHILVFIPSHKQNLADAIWMDYRWHNTLEHIINEQFNAWRNRDQN